MKYLNQLHEGEKFKEIYLVRSYQNAQTKNGKEYLNLTLSDKTMTVNAKVWDPSDPGIDDFDKNDYVHFTGDVTVFNGTLQLNVRGAKKAREGSYDPADYLPVSRYNIEDMYKSLLEFVDGLKEPHLKKLCADIFIEDKEFVKAFKTSSAAKSVHHSFAGGLLEHTLRVTSLCSFFAKSYTYLNRDLLITAALCHDMAKVWEFTPFPENDYSDEGQLIGHIVLGAEKVAEYAHRQADFPEVLLRELRHCILSHHGKLEYGSPKLPSLAEAIALHYADDTDAKLETMREALENAASAGQTGWLGKNFALDTNIRKTIGAGDV